jgi:hypothetical protein
MPSTTVSETTITSITPPAPGPGPVDVLVFNDEGFDSLAGALTYNDAPTVTAITPDTGSGGGGLAVTITGTGFMNFDAGTNLVTIGGAECTDVTVASDTELSCTTGPGLLSCQDVDVVVTNTNGSGTLEDGFFYGGTIFAVGGRGAVAGTGNLYSIDVCTGVATTIGAMGRQVSGSAFHAGTLYASEVNRSGGIANLISINTTTGAGTVVGPLNTIFGSNHPHMPDLTSDGVSLYGWTEAGDDLTTINTANGQVTVIFSPLGSAGSGIAANAAGTIYAALNNACGPLQTINKTTGAGTSVATMTGSTACVGINGMTFHNGQLFGVRKDNNPGQTLLKINHTTGAVTVVGLPGGLPNPIESIASPTP